MWNLDSAILIQIALRTAIVYALLLIGVRLAGKRQIGQLTPFDLVVLLLLSNAVQNAMTGPDTSVTGGIVAAATLLVCNAAVAFARTKSTAFRRCVEGVPVVLISHGEIQHRNLQHEEITEGELRANLREHEVEKIEDVELAMLEIDGTVSVIRRDGAASQGFVHTRKKYRRHHRNSQ
ncbi:MAG: DUF421 domain-containing protein [Armatimonadetes bacterium]|nr:DUF421 domain-containing protein [Armatimonadota bacterium]